jgi:hypothetical protein
MQRLDDLLQHSARPVAIAAQTGEYPIRRFGVDSFIYAISPDMTQGQILGIGRLDSFVLRTERSRRGG